MKNYIVLLIVSFSIVCNSQCLNGDCENGLSRLMEADGTYIGHFKDGEKHGLGILYNNETYKLTTTYNVFDNGIKQGVQYTNEKYAAGKNATKTYQHYEDGYPVYPAIRLTYGSFSDIEVKYSEYGGWESAERNERSGNMKIKAVDEDDATFLGTFKNERAVVKMSIAHNSGAITLYQKLNSSPYYTNHLVIKQTSSDFKVYAYLNEGEVHTGVFIDNEWEIDDTKKGSWEYFKNDNEQLDYKVSYEELLKKPSRLEKRKDDLDNESFNIIVKANSKQNDGTMEPQYISQLENIISKAKQENIELNPIIYYTLSRLYYDNENYISALENSKTYKLLNPDDFYGNLLYVYAKLKQIFVTANEKEESGEFTEPEIHKYIHESMVALKEFVKTLEPQATSEDEKERISSIFAQIDPNIEGYKVK